MTEEQIFKILTDHLCDPVLATSGKYILKETDFIISGTNIVISRKYMTSDELLITGSIGNYWITSIDNRIIRRISPVDEAKWKPPFGNSNVAVFFNNHDNSEKTTLYNPSGSFIITDDRSSSGVF